MNKLFMSVRMAIEDGKAGDFRNTLAEVIGVAKDGAEGLRGYEWFLSEDGRECTVVEIYDDPVAHAKHVQRVVLPHASKLREFSTAHISLAGNVPAEMLTNMRARLGDVPYLGPCVSGILDSATATTPAASHGIHACIVVQAEIQQNKGDAVLSLACSVTARIASQNKIAAFEWFFDENTHHLTIIGLSEHQESLAPETTRVLTELTQVCSIAKVTLDAPGIDIAIAKGISPSAALGRTGGTHIAGVL